MRHEVRWFQGSRFHQGYEGKNHNHERSVCFLDVFLRGLGFVGGEFSSQFLFRAHWTVSFIGFGIVHFQLFLRSLLHKES